MKKIFYYILCIILLVLISIIGVNIYVISFSDNWYYSDLESINFDKKTWIVFGASVLNNNFPSDILKDRLDMSFNAYELWIVDEIIVSWDSREEDYSESWVMYNYLLSLWVDKDDLIIDYYWLDTYDSLYRAKNNFDKNELVLFTQDFHLKRAMYISKRLWIKTYWIDSSLHKYNNNVYPREILARIKAFLEIEVFKPKDWDWILKKDKLFE